MSAGLDNWTCLILPEESPVVLDAARVKLCVDVVLLNLKKTWQRIYYSALFNVYSNPDNLGKA